MGPREYEETHPTVSKETYDKAVSYYQGENKRLREALEFYAPYEKYEDDIQTTYGYTCEIAYDEGKTARNALKGDSK